jgi:hypothetical protein
MLTHVVNAGQTGVEVAALRAARTAGLLTGGWMPFGFLTDDGPRPGIADLYGLRESDRDDVSRRTRRNVREADATLIVGHNLNSLGSRHTRHYCRDLRRPSQEVQWQEVSRDLRNPDDPAAFDAEITESVARWLAHFSVVHVTGNRDSWMEWLVESWLREVFALATPRTLDL